MYRLLKDPYYCGKFEYPKNSGSWYKVGHESIVDNKLFEEVQAQLAVAPRSSPGTKKFDFIKLMKCGSCGSGVTAQEKFKNIKDGSVRRYVYYHCTDGATRTCREPWINEPDLVDQLCLLMDKVDLDKVKVGEKFNNELRRYQRFSQAILAQPDSAKTPPPTIDFRKFARYILQEGSPEDRRELLSCLKGKIFLKDLKVYV